MLDVRSLLHVSDSKTVLRLFSLLLGLSMLLLLDILLIIEASRLWGSYLVMAVIASSGIVLLALAMNSISRLNRQLRKKIRKGIYPEREFASVGGVLMAGLLFLFPGALTNAIGLLLLLPPFRVITGKIVTRSQQSRLQETYEYLKIQEFSHSM